MGIGLNPALLYRRMEEPAISGKARRWCPSKNAGRIERHGLGGVISSLSSNRFVHSWSAPSLPRGS